MTGPDEMSGDDILTVALRCTESQKAPSDGDDVGGDAVVDSCSAYLVKARGTQDIFGTWRAKDTNFAVGPNPMEVQVDGNPQDSRALMRPEPSSAVTPHLPTFDSMPSWSHSSIAGRTLPILNFENGNQSPARYEMSDNKKQVGKPDRSRVSSTERYEVDYLAKKHELPPPLVKKIIQQEGPTRKNVESYLDRMKRNGKL
jgi:hypothetical protein